MLGSNPQVTRAKVQQFGPDGVPLRAVVLLDVSVDLQGTEQTMDVAG